jgi:hypothetical protein
MASTLTKWNYVACGVHTAATIISYAILSPSGRPFRMVNMKYLTFDVNAPPSESRVDLPIALEDDISFDLKFLVVTFFAITAFAHLLYATDFFGRGWYTKAVFGYGWNPYRWIEYSLSAGVMTYLITIVSGTKEQISALASALIVPSLMISGLTTERALNQNHVHKWSLKPVGRPKVDPVVVWFNILPSWFLFFTNWMIILVNYVRISRKARQSGRPVDFSVSFMVFSQLAFFSMFGVILSYQTYRWATVRRGRIEPAFISYEKAYIVLSAVTKLALAATVVYAMRDG